MSKDITIKAEKKFLALMEIMASASSTATSLKEIWMEIISERESWCAREDELLEQIQEYCETIEQTEKEHHHHNHNREETKKTVDTLRLEITALTASVAEYKRKCGERDHDLEHCRHELHETKETVTRIREQYEDTKRSYEEVQLKLTVCEEDRDSARADAEKHHHELRTLTREYNELKSSFTEVTENFESSRKEISILHEKVSFFEKERHEWLHEKGLMEEDLRKCRHRYDECERKRIEITEKYEKKVREVTKIQESLKRVETERDEIYHKIEHLQREIDAKCSDWEDAEDRCGKWKLKYEHCERELTSIRERIRTVESERTELRESISKIREEHRLIVIERDQLKEDYHNECKKSAEHHRKILMLQESLRRTESTLKEVREEVHSLTEKIMRIQTERDSAVHRCSDLDIELGELRASVMKLKLEITTLTQARDRVCEELDSWKHKYEQVSETITDFHEDSSGFEYEIENMRVMLREAREQKEKAIGARNSADRERDEAIARYEDKCREMERWEESMSQQLHHLSHSQGGRRETRVVKRTTSSSSHANGHSHSHESHGQGHSHESNGHESRGHGHALIHGTVHEE
jgi:chromosome segregation ATPase